MRTMGRVPDRIPPGPIKLRYEDYVDLPDDGRRYEILDGELEVSPAPAPRHQAVLRDLTLAVYGHVREWRLGDVYFAPIDVILADTSIVQPDFVFIAAGRATIITHHRPGNRRSAGPRCRDPFALVHSQGPGRESSPPCALRHSTLLDRGSGRTHPRGVGPGPPETLR